MLKPDPIAKSTFKFWSWTRSSFLLVLNILIN